MKKLVLFIILMLMLSAAPAALAAPDFSPQEQRAIRLIELDSVFRTDGAGAWLEAAGIDCSSVSFESRQPLEEVLKDPRTGSNHITVVGMVLRGTCSAGYPAGFTTDRAVVIGPETRSVQPDSANSSRIYTNASFVEIPVTVYADVSDWSELWPRMYLPIQKSYSN